MLSVGLSGVRSPLFNPVLAGGAANAQGRECQAMGPVASVCSCSLAGSPCVKRTRLEAAWPCCAHEVRRMRAKKWPGWSPSGVRSKRERICEGTRMWVREPLMGIQGESTVDGCPPFTPAS